MKKKKQDNKNLESIINLFGSVITSYMDFIYITTGLNKKNFKFFYLYFFIMCINATLFIALAYLMLGNSKYIFGFILAMASNVLLLYIGRTKIDKIEDDDIDLKNKK